ncbi:unnamed protein product [Adineta steineri]|uniref:LITAF domain-containing protein n=1 Tax=Adineta steineri TaxID=433720 RepID=A0A819C058_9BILA|nr:unnamed protein product [Adineta steineri]
MADTKPNNTAGTKPNNTADTKPNNTADTKPNHTADTKPNNTAGTKPNHTADTKPNNTADTRPDEAVIEHPLSNDGYLPKLSIELPPRYDTAQSSASSQIHQQSSGTSFKYGQDPLNCKCIYCHQQVVTRIEKENGLIAWICCAVLLLIGCWLGCCLIPFFIDDLKQRKIMSTNNSNTTATTSKPVTDPEAARTAAQTDHRHHPIPIPDHANTSTHTENHSNNKTATSSSDQVASQSTN